jgi:carbamoyltransferase
VLEEHAGEYFDLPLQGMRSPFMTFVVKVHEDKRELLKATTHVDGTARIQTVSKETNSRFWQLIDEFRKRTGVPVLLNTSFNNNAEPIVCFLTTRLNYLVVGNYLVSKKNIDDGAYLELAPSLPRYARLVQSRRFISDHQMATVCELANSYHHQYNLRISTEAFDVLKEANGKTSLGNLLHTQDGTDQTQHTVIIEEMLRLWFSRAVTLHPRRIPGDPCLISDLPDRGVEPSRPAL